MKKLSFLLFFILGLLAYHSHGQSITISGDQFLSIDSMIFTYEDPGFSDTDWIGVYPEGITPGEINSTAWQYVTGESGTAVFKDTIPGGKYVAYLLCCDGYEVKDSTVVFTILEPKLVLNESTILEGDTITFDYESPLFSETDWVGFYNVGEVPGEGPFSSYWQYIPDATGTVSFTGVPAGDYEVYLFCCDGYRALASLTITVGASDQAYIKPVKDVFDPTDDISFEFNNPEYEEADWIGVYFEGDDPELTAAVSWVYISSDRGVATLEESLPAGTYEAYLFCCDVTDIIFAKSEVFTSSGGAVASFLRSSATIYPAGSNIEFNYRSSGYSDKDWIGIYLNDGNVPGSSNPSIDYVYAPVDSGSVEMTTELAPGDYTAFLLCCDGYEVKAKTDFTIVDESLLYLKATSLTYASHNDISITYNDPDFSETDWVGIYRPGEVPGGGFAWSLAWEYVSETPRTMAYSDFTMGTADDGGRLETLEYGEYWAGLFCCDGYELYAKIIFFIVEGNPVSASDISSPIDALFVFPNPSTGLVTINSQNGTPINKVEVFNMSGQIMFSKNLNNSGSETTINLSGLDNGNYIMKARSETHIYNTKLVINQ